MTKGNIPLPVYLLVIGWLVFLIVNIAFLFGRNRINRNFIGESEDNATFMEALGSLIGQAFFTPLGTIINFLSAPEIFFLRVRAGLGLVSEGDIEDALRQAATGQGRRQ
jgi:hypothetical protein